MNTKCRNTANTNTVTEIKPDMDLLDILLDGDNCDPIALTDENGRRIVFEQVAIIPHEDASGTKNLYVILKPIDRLEGIGENDAIVFAVNINARGAVVLQIEQDEMIAIDVFNKYYDLLEATTGNK